MHLELLNPLTWKQFKKMTSDSVWEKARENWNKVHCSCVGDRKGLEASPCLDHGQVLLAQLGHPRAAGYMCWQLWASSCRSQRSLPSRGEGLERKRRFNKRKTCSSCSMASQTKTRKQNGMLNEVHLSQIPSSVKWLLVLLCLKAKEEFAETWSAILQFLLLPSQLFVFAVQGNEKLAAKIDEKLVHRRVRKHSWEKEVLPWCSAPSKDTQGFR